MKIFVYFLAFLLLLNFVSATDIPQVIFTSVNLTITMNSTSGYYQIYGEGVNAYEYFSVANSTNFTFKRDNIPITLSRVFKQNDTDVAILLNALALNNNMSLKWEDCKINLSTCLTDYGYRQNYTDCTQGLALRGSEVVNINSQLTTIKDENTTLKSHRLYLGIAAALMGFLAFYFYKKVTPKSIKSPIDQFPSNPRIS